MATANLPDDLAEDLLCPVCLEFFNEPVMLACGHNFCKDCIDVAWGSEKVPSCPECREEFPEKKYTVNRVLRKVVQAVPRPQPVEIPSKPHQEQKSHCVDESQQCLTHKEALKLFCWEDECPICVICMVSSKHAGHNFQPLYEAVSTFQEKLKTAASGLEIKMKHLKECQEKQEQKISGIKDKSQTLEQHITSKFARLYQFLQDKEQQLMQRLKEETAGILGKMNQNLKKIEEMTQTIQLQISDIHLKVQEENPVLFVKDMKAEMERIMRRQEKEDNSDSMLVSGDLSLGVYKGPLEYSIWKAMLSVISPVPFPVTLDHNTAHPKLTLSEDMLSVKAVEKAQHFQDNAERFDYFVSVLGSEGFTSGSHYWEVDVRNKIKWDVGITRESSNRKGSSAVNLENGYWRIVLRNGNAYCARDSPTKDIHLTVKPQKIGVYLDYEEGQLSFYNADNMSHIYTFTLTFNETVYPYFWVGNNDKGDNAEPLKLSHLKL
ncbi:zinc-binding protein A33-like [Protopterus annectens]|uniref:zinc-binding protein A33-like n=1 Tax=Protopterus annectens TaxID=7888 RepID=UPI001CFA42A6|nr:zinc-binding protein A33-like [Protopterus annectens]